MCRFLDETKEEVWSKAKVIDGYDSSRYRQDACGAWIMHDKYNDRTSDFGWEIDHVVPQKVLKEKGATQEEIDNETNLRPMNWRNNLSKGIDYPVYRSCIEASDGKNVPKECMRIVNDDLRFQLSRLYSKYL